MTHFYPSVPSRVKTVCAWLFCMLLPHAVCAAETIDTDYAARLIWQAKQNGDWLPDIYRLNPQLEDSTLYAIQNAYVTRRLASGDVIGGYKSCFCLTPDESRVIALMFPTNKKGAVERRLF